MQQENEDESYLNYKLQKYKEHIAFDVESWCHIIHDYTPSCEFINITPAQADAVVKFYRYRWNLQSNLEIETVHKLNELENILESKIEQGKDYFVRCSNRSPKDGLSLSVNLRQEYERHLHELLAAFPPKSKEDEENLKMVAISTVQMTLLKVRNAKEVMNLLLTSERVYSDFMQALVVIDKQPWNTHVILRGWDYRINDEMEFRLFCYKERLIAISQYNHYCVFPPLAQINQQNEERNKLKNAIIAFWAQMHQLLVADTVPDEFKKFYKEGYIIDFAVFENDDLSYGATVIELNPYARSTGACLFDWNEIDKLVKEEKDVAFRIREENMENLGDFLNSVIMPAVDSNEPAYYTFYPQIPEQITATSTSWVTKIKNAFFW